MTQIGFVGLGKMGGNMVHRIRRDSDHEVVAFDFDEKAVAQAVKKGAVGAKSLADLVKKLRAPRIVWIMVPAGKPTQETVDKLAKLLDRGDIIVDGGNSKWTDDKLRSKALKPSGIDYIDVGTSGGVWGLEVGYCMMVGGPQAAVKQLAPILDVLAPETNDASRSAIGPRGWLRFGPSGAGHYVKMVHNGVEYGLMQAYAEGFDVFDKSEYELDNAKIAHLWGQGSVVRSWLCELAAPRSRPTATTSRRSGLHRGLGRGPLDDRGRDRTRRPDTGHNRLALRAPAVPRQRRLRDRVLAALRNQFGGHAVKSAPRLPRSRSRNRDRRAQGRGRCPRRTLNMAATAAQRAWTRSRTRSRRGWSGCRSPTTLVIFGATATWRSANSCRRSTTRP